MTTLSDVQALYGSVRSTWAKSHAHVIAHIILAAVVFGLCGATVPAFALATLNAEQILNNEWFVLAKDTGLIYVALVIPVIIFAAYAALLQAGGALVVGAFMMMVPPSSRRNPYRLLTSSALEPLAIALGKSDFRLSDIQNKSSEFVLKYRSSKNEQWVALEHSISHLTKDTQVYLGDYLLFLLIWSALFWLLPQVPWIQSNETCYWPVTLVMLALVWFAWFRVSRAISVVPSLLLMSVAQMVRSDPDMKAVLDVTDEKRDTLRLKLDDLLHKEQEHDESGPSLWGFIKSRTGQDKENLDIHEQMALEGGNIFISLFRKGRRFSWDRSTYQAYDRKWLRGYLAYLYYCICVWVMGLVRAIWQVAQYIVTGAP